MEPEESVRANVQPAPTQTSLATKVDTAARVAVELHLDHLKKQE